MALSGCHHFASSALCQHVYFAFFELIPSISLHGINVPRRHLLFTSSRSVVPQSSQENMKAILLIASLVVAVSNAVPSVKDHWASFKREHGKTYESPGEEQKRFDIFMDNLKMIEEHNAKYAAGLVSYYLKMNRFGDMLLDEASALMKGFNKAGHLKNVVLSNEPEKDSSLPSSIDWREKGAVTPVKDQGHCESSWAFSATGAVEGQLFKNTGKLVSLSEQQLIDCSQENNGCVGGSADLAFFYLRLSDEDGLATEEDWPYIGKEGECSNDSDPVKGTIVMKVVDVAKKNETALQKAVATAGPISVTISAGNHGFMYYGGGIFSGDTCNSTKLDHGILAVGYGSEDGQDYWILKNSWGPKWGEKGYIRLARNKDNACQIATRASYPLL